jgi:hypothetical protein
MSTDIIEKERRRHFDPHVVDGSREKFEAEAATAKAATTDRLA